MVPTTTRRKQNNQKNSNQPPKNNPRRFKQLYTQYKTTNTTPQIKKTLANPKNKQHHKQPKS